MILLKICFWFLFFIVFYTYIGYGILLFILVRIKRLFSVNQRKDANSDFEPEVTLFIPAYNEKDFIEAKVNNSRELDYPADKLHFMWVTDGSDDGTPDLLKRYKEVEVYHLDLRSGKINAMNRGMKFVKTPLVVFSDANTILGKDSIRRITRLFSDPKVGCVSGEKRILNKEKDAAAGAGEGIYWKYESLLKKWDAELYSVVGAAGELFAIRTDLYQEVEKDTLLDDFIISLRIAQQGYTIQYDPEAYAMESASASIGEELKRKIRIAAGGIQSVIRLKSLLNFFSYRILSFQYISHRVLRWTLAPLSLLLMFVASFILALRENFAMNGLFTVIFWLQVMFYLAAMMGWYLENRSVRLKILFIPYYFFIMNLAMYLGLIRYLKKEQSVNWERAKRG